jgi:hypothetical protein
MRTRCYGLLALIVIAIVVRASVVVPAQTSDTIRNRDVVRRHLDLMNRGDWRQAAELFAPGCATPFRELANRDGSRVPRQNASRWQPRGHLPNISRLEDGDRGDGR